MCGCNFTQLLSGWAQVVYLGGLHHPCPAPFCRTVSPSPSRYRS
jgi:hypothetical protein